MEIIQSYKFDLSAYKYEIRNNTLIIIPNELIKETIQEVTEPIITEPIITEPIITEPIITEPIQEKWKSDKNIRNGEKLEFRYKMFKCTALIEKQNNKYVIRELIIDSLGQQITHDEFSTLNSVGTFLIKKVNVNRKAGGDVWANFYVNNKKLETHIKDRLNIH